VATVSSARRERFIPDRSGRETVGEEFTRHATMIFSPDKLEPDLVQDTAAGGVVHGHVRIQRDISGVGQVPAHQGCSDLGRQAVTPQIASEGVGQLATVQLRPKSGTSDEMIIEIDHPPFRETGRGVLCHVLIDQSRCLLPCLRPTLAHEPHGLRVRVHSEQIIDVAGEPRRRDQTFSPQCCAAISYTELSSICYLDTVKQQCGHSNLTGGPSQSETLS